MARAAPIVFTLLLINLLFFAAGALVPRWNSALLEYGAWWYPAHEYFRPWQAVSYLFLHAGFAHLFFNMFALVSFGSILERQWGGGRFLGFYFLCGLGAGLTQIAVHWHQFAGLQEQLVASGVSESVIEGFLLTGHGRIPSDPAVREALLDLYRIYAAPMLGASGAIYGILVAFGILYPNAKLTLMFIPAPVAAKFFIPVLLAIDLLSGVTGFSLFGAGVAHFAHLGGAAVGFLLMLLWRRRRRLNTTAPSPFVASS